MARRAAVYLSLCALAAMGLAAAIFKFDSVKAQTISPSGPVPAIANRATASLPSGATLYKKHCSNCHELDEDDRGPALRDVYGRMAGHKAGFAYSKSLSARFFNWDETNLDIWLQGPNTMIPGVRMRRHVPIAAERTAIIGYLKSVNPNQSKNETSQ